MNQEHSATGYSDSGDSVPYQQQDDYEENVPVCEVCGYECEREECYQCHGEGGRDLYEDDPLWYAPGDWETCEECNGDGYYWVCPSLPHSDRVLTDYHISKSAKEEKEAQGRAAV